MNAPPTPRMTLEQFQDLLDTYGAEPARWPRERRELARALASEEPRAAQLLAECRALEAQLDELPRLSPTPELLRRVAEVPVRHPRSPRVWGIFFSHWWLPAAAAACAVFIGGLSGWSSYDEPTAGSAEGEEWAEASALALATDLDEGWE